MWVFNDNFYCHVKKCALKSVSVCEIFHINKLDYIAIIIKL
jgi:hypothetical protein